MVNAEYTHSNRGEHPKRSWGGEPWGMADPRQAKGVGGALGDGGGRWGLGWNQTGERGSRGHRRQAAGVALGWELRQDTTCSSAPLHVNQNALPRTHLLRACDGMP